MSPRIRARKKITLAFGRSILFFSVKVNLYILEEEKERALGPEPVTKYLSSARFKSGNNVMLDIVCYKADDSWYFS